MGDYSPVAGFDIGRLDWDVEGLPLLRLDVQLSGFVQKSAMMSYGQQYGW